MEKLTFAFALICSGIFLGYILQLLAEKDILLSKQTIPHLRKTLQKIGLLVFMPISFLASVWIVSLSDYRLFFLPLIGILALSCGGILGFIYSTLFNSSSRQKGVLFCCGSFTNIGAIGGLVCYVFLGEAGFALVALYKMFEEMFYYTIGFPIAKFCAQNSNEQTSFVKRLLGVFTDPFVLTALFAFSVGATLNFVGVERPKVFELFSSISVPAGTFVLLVSIGLGMRFSSVSMYIKESIAISSIKFIFVPIITVCAGYFLGLGTIMDGLPLKVICIVSSMPVAFNALVAASIYDLELDLANSCWLVSTASLIIVMPWLYFLTQHL